MMLDLMLIKEINHCIVGSFARIFNGLGSLENKDGGEALYVIGCHF
jgi:hypothetical protein